MHVFSLIILQGIHLCMFFLDTFSTDFKHVLQFSLRFIKFKIFILFLIVE